MKPIRILHVVKIMNDKNPEKTVMDYYRNIDLSQVQFDFMVHTHDRGELDRQIEKMGGKIYRMPPFNPQNIKKYFKELDQFFKEHKEYKIIHSHSTFPGAFVLTAAKENHVPVRIAQSHHTNFMDEGLKNTLKYHSQNILDDGSTHRIIYPPENTTSSKKETPRPTHIIKKGIDLAKHSFDQTIRDKTRASLGLTTEFLIGHIGRFTHQENHSFLIDVFDEISKEIAQARLLLIGDGKQRKAIQKKVEKLALSDKITFLAPPLNPDKYLMAMDLLLYPSISQTDQSLPLKAQTGGLPILASEYVHNHSEVTHLMEFLPLELGPYMWARYALKFQNHQREASSEHKITEAGYDIKTISQWLQDFYLQNYKDKTEVI